MAAIGRSFIVLAISGAALLPPNQAFAQAKTNEDLLNSCFLFEKPSLTVMEAISFEQCRSYIAGFYDGWTAARMYSGEAEISDPFVDICFPQAGEVTYLQLARVVIHWLTDRPETHHQPAWQGIRAAFGHAFPCE